MKAHPIRGSRNRSGYTLIEVIAASGLIAAALGAASSLGMTMTTQEELARGQASAIRYAEAIARIWQLGVSPADILLTQPQSSPGSTSYGTMTYSIALPTTESLGSDGGISQGSVEKTTVSVTYLPYGNAQGETVTINFDVIRPIASHR